MRSFIQAVLAMVVVLGVVAAAPRGAEAQECVQRHFDWVGSAPSGGGVRSERIQVVQTNDTLGWTGHATFSLAYTPGRFNGTFFFPARLSGDGRMSFSDRNFCSQYSDPPYPLCTMMQNFSAFDTDSVRVTFVRNLLGSQPATFRFDALRWGFNHQPTNGVCINNNTVAYSMPGDVTYLVTFTDVEGQPPPR
jgi:hypothetical protein